MEMMELLITPETVAETAFCAPDFITADAIPPATILAAQQKFIRPVLGGLYGSLCRGEYPEFLAEYIVPPLALYVKLSMLPSLAVQAGMAGVVEADPENLVRASEAKLRDAVRRLRSDATALMRRAVERIESDPAAYPEYNPRHNVLNRCSIEGQIVLDKLKKDGEAMGRDAD
jgi:hypothetical protein